MVNSYPYIYKINVVQYYFSRKWNVIKDILDIFKISNGVFYNWIKDYKLGVLGEKKRYTKVSKINNDIQKHICDIVTNNINFHYKEMISAIKLKFNINISKSYIYKILKDNGITNKRKTVRFIYKNLDDFNNKKNEYKEKIKAIDKNKIISIDETHIDNHIHQNYGWSKKGEKIVEEKYTSKKHRLTMLCAISNKRIIHYKLIKGSAFGTDFNEFMKEIINKRPKEKILLLDNAGIHHNKLLKKYINRTSYTLQYNYPYSPELNPIELLFNKIKSKLKQKNNIKIKHLKENINDSIKNIKKNFLKNIYNKTFNY